MRNSWIRRIVGAAAFAGLATWTLTGEAANPLPEGNGTLAADIAFLQKGLSKEPQKREVPTLKAVAMLIALNAQNQMDGKDAAKMAGVRDAALAVAGAVTKKDFAAAKTAAASLSDAKPAADAKPVTLGGMHKFDLDELMSSFRKGTVGGLNLEADVKAQSKKVTDPQAAAVIAGRVALIGEYTLGLPPEGIDAAKKKQWDAWSKEMTTLAADIAKESAKADKADKVKMATGFRNLDANCNACHTAFRN